MRVILDANIIISALVRNSVTRAVITLSGDDFYYPHEALKEIEKYKSLIQEKSGVEEKEYKMLLNKLLRRVTLVEQEKIQPFWKEAEDIMGKTDPKDTIFIACALAHRNSVIWSDDSHFDKQNRIKIWKTTDILERNNMSWML